MAVSPVLKKRLPLIVGGSAAVAIAMSVSASSDGHHDLW